MKTAKTKKTARATRRVSRLIVGYVAGCVAFFLLALVSIWFGYFLVRYRYEYHLPSWLILLSVAGVLLLVEIVKAFHIDTKMPPSFTPASEHDYPELFALLREVTTSLGLSPIHRVYTCSDATAAVFILPKMRNLLFQPKRNLVVGLGLLTQMDDDELRAVLYHELGHYVQNEMRSSLSVYTVRQFAQSFIAVKKPFHAGTIESQMRSQVVFFTLFSISMCRRINEASSQLVRQMEFSADDVAVKFVGAHTLQRALIHASCLAYNWGAVTWGARLLKESGIHVDNIYQALSLVGTYSHPTLDMFPRMVVRRIERLGELMHEPCDHTHRVRDAIVHTSVSCSHSEQTCTPQQFAQWMRRGIDIYVRRANPPKIVPIEVYMDPHKHRLPLIDANYDILLDGKSIGKGNFLRGFHLKRKISVGNHTLEAFALTGLIPRRFDFVAEQDHSYYIGLDYKLHLTKGAYEVFVKNCSESVG